MGQWANGTSGKTILGAIYQILGTMNRELNRQCAKLKNLTNLQANQLIGINLIVHRFTRANVHQSPWGHGCHKQTKRMVLFSKAVI